MLLTPVRFQHLLGCSELSLNIEPGVIPEHHGMWPKVKQKNLTFWGDPYSDPVFIPSFGFSLSDRILPNGNAHCLVGRVMAKLIRVSGQPWGWFFGNLRPNSGFCVVLAAASADLERLGSVRWAPSCATCGHPDLRETGHQGSRELQGVTHMVLLPVRALT